MRVTYSPGACAWAQALSGQWNHEPQTTTTRVGLVRHPLPEDLGGSHEHGAR